MCEALVGALDRTTSAIEHNCDRISKPRLRSNTGSSDQTPMRSSARVVIEHTPRRPCFMHRPSRHRFMPVLWNSKAVTRDRAQHL
jgi:hypothetical protein